MEFYELTIIFLLGIMVSIALSYIFNEQIKGIQNSFRMIPAFDRREKNDRRSMADRRGQTRGVIERRQDFRRATDTSYG